MDEDLPATERTYKEFHDGITRLLRSVPARRAGHVRSITALARPVYAAATKPVYDAAAQLHQLAIQFLSVSKREEMTFKRRISVAQAAFKNAAKKELGI